MSLFAIVLVLLGGLLVAPPAATARESCDSSSQPYEGSGSKVVRLDLCPDFLYIVTISHAGSGNFIVESVDAQGDDLGLLVNTIGDYEGTRPLDWEGDPAAVAITADGLWTMVVKYINLAPTWDGVEATGNGDAILMVAPELLDAVPVVELTHEGAENFIVVAYGSGVDTLVNEIGVYSGETLLPSDTVVLEIVADGSWTFSAA